MSPAGPKYVAYLRVSTRRQQRSGLGLDAQAERVREMVQAQRGRLVATFTEAESGRRDDRPELHRALQMCRAHGAVLIVARLDRLARNARFLLSILDAGADVLACDIPHVNRFTVTVLAAVAEQESRSISERTRAALAQARRRGVQLGRPENMTTRARRKGPPASARVRQERATKRAADLAPIVEQIRADGATSLREIAAALDARGLTTPRGSSWTATAVRRMLARVEIAGPAA